MRNPLRRLYGRGDLHFVTFSCYRRRQYLGTRRARHSFVRILDAACSLRRPQRRLQSRSEDSYPTDRGVTPQRVAPEWRAYLNLIWSGRLRPVLVVVFFRHIILRHFACLNRALIRIRSIFHAAHNSRFEGLPFLEQFVGALRVHTLHSGYPSEIAATRARPCPQRSRFHLHRLYILAAHCGLPQTGRSFLRGRSALRRLFFLPTLRAQFCFRRNSALARCLLLATLLVLLFHCRTPS